MRKYIIIAALSLFALSSVAFGFIELFFEIGPSDKAEGYHTQFKVERAWEGKVLLTLPRLDDAPNLEAWLVVCQKARGEGRRNFRYDVHWPESKAKKPDIDLVVPVKFGTGGIAKMQVTEDVASRSYIVFGGHFDDGNFYTVDLPSFLAAADEPPKK